MGEGPETEGATGREGELRVIMLAPLALSVQFTTTVVACRPAELQTETSGGKKEILSGFQVVLEDTLLFPEGGGQVPGAASARPPPANPHIPVRRKYARRRLLASISKTGVFSSLHSFSPC